jgi:hypothetical protein
MKRIVLLSVLIMFSLSFIVNAAPDSAITGPYKVSFDLGLENNSDYLALSTDPITSEALSGDKYTEYSMGIFSKKGEVTITIKNIEEKLPIINGPAWNQFLISETKDDPQISNFHSSQRTIDGVASAVASFSQHDSGSVVEKYWAMYQPLFDQPHTTVNMISTFPWDEGTLNLLKTIHVEKAS